MKYINPNNWVSGIYKIISPDGYYYIGSTNNFNRRCFAEHLRNLKNGNHNNVHMQNRYNKYPDNWVFEVCENVHPDLLISVEDNYIKQNFGNKFCMNLSNSAYKPPGMKGKKLTLNHKQNISKSMMGRKFTNEHKLKLSQSLKGRPNLSSKGIKKTTEQKIKMALKILSKSDKTILFQILTDNNLDEKIKDVIKFIRL